MSKDNYLKIRCDDGLLSAVDAYVADYNEKYGHFKKRTRSRIVEEAIWEYIWRHRNSIPFIEDGR